MPRIILRYQRPNKEIVEIDSSRYILVELWCRQDDMLRADQNCPVIFAEEDGKSLACTEDVFEFMEHQTFLQKAHMAAQTYKLNMSGHKKELEKLHTE